MNSLIGCVECPMVMTIKGAGVALFFMPYVRLEE
jgi:hypothetical protein